MMVRCEDPRQGLELGLKISEHVSDEDGLPPLRVGVHTGPAVYRDGDWFGGAVNVAARLCSAAGGGEVLVSEAAHEAAGSPRHIDFGDRRLHWLKNIPEPVAAGSVVRRERSPAHERLHDAGKRLIRRPLGRTRLQHREVTS
jgi:adenylate cyclase